MKQKSIFFLFLLCETIHAQNLVLNPGFELHQCAPWYISSLENCTHWSNPTLSSPDFFNNKCKKHAERIPSNPWGFQASKAGESHAGLIAYDYRRNDPDNVGAEYLQGKFVEPLKAGEEYIVEFSVSLAECSKITLLQLGVYFSDKPVLEKTNGLLKLAPQFTSDLELKDTSGWMLVSGKYTALGNETHFIIGCFDKGKKIRFEKVKPSPTIVDPRDYAYYFVDEVSVKPVKPYALSKPEIVDSWKLETAISVPVATALTIGQSFILKNISFASSSFQLDESSFAELDSLVSLMRQNTKMRILVSGHTDNTGDALQNKKLSQQRAESVAKYLFSKKIEQSRVRFEGFGDAQPIAPNDTPAERKLNRRVEILITGV